MIRMLILADDLTGANDVGAQFSRRGIPVYVAMGASCPIDTLWARFAVVVIDTETRHTSGRTAAARIKRLVRAAQRAGVTHFYKKTDSTLRGNIAREIAALRRATGVAVVHFIPGLPELGRTTRNGVQLVDGIPLHKTAFARDPRNPARESDVICLLRREAADPVIGVPVGSRGRLSETVHGIVVHDSGSTRDLWRIARHLKTIGNLRVVAGTAAFGEQLASLLPFRRGRRRSITVSGRFLLVNGSLNPVSLRQTQRARQDGFQGFPLGPALLFPRSPVERMAAGAWVRHVAQALREGRNVAVWTLRHRAEERAFGRQSAERGIAADHLHAQVAKNLGRLIHGVLQGAAPLTLIVFGGDTLLALARASAWHGFEPVGELIAGVTLSVAAPSGQEIVS